MVRYGGPDAPPVVTDGPFPEAKEFLAGYYMIDVDSVERAYEIAAQASSAPGPERCSDLRAHRGASDHGRTRS